MSFICGLKINKHGVKCKMANISTKKTEKTALNKIENLLDNLKTFDYNFVADNTGISWDGYIDIYHGNIDDKGNFDARIDVQIKGRTANIKKLQSKWKFDIDKKDLENYNKIDGTLFLAVRFLKNGDFKIYYKSLLPKNITDLLKEQPNAKNEIRITLKEVKNDLDLENICRNFALDKETQKKLSKEIFNHNVLSVGNQKLGTFSNWHRGKFNPITILGEEKFIYILDDNKNIIDVEYAEITEVVQGLNIAVKNKNGKIYYSIVNHSAEVLGTQKLIFGKAFSLLDKPKKFSIKLSGSLKERLKQLELIKDIIKDNGFYIGNIYVTVKMNEKNIEKYNKMYETYLKLNNFCKKHNIEKDINLDIWSNKDVNDFLLWIDAIDNNKNINIKEWNCSMLGSIQIKDIRFSIFAEKLENNVFRIYSIWNDDRKNRYQFRYGEDDEEAIYTKKFFSILNEEAYLSDDVNINEMKQYYEENPLEDKEETLLNFQVLELLKAFDANRNVKLLDYAKFLLEKISIYKNIFDVARVNFLQTEKRLRDLREKEISELIEIRNRHSDNTFFNLSTNLLIGNIPEAKIIYNSLNEDERNVFLEYPISRFLKK